MRKKAGIDNLVRLTEIYRLLESFRELRPEMPMQMASVFLVVAMRPGVQQCDLPDIIGVSQSSVSRNVTALTSRTRHGSPGLNLIKRSLDPEGGRSPIIHLTAAGKQLTERLLNLRSVHSAV